MRPCALLATFTVSNTNDSDPGSLRQAILDANDNPGLDRIVFEIGTGLQTISPLQELPTIDDPVDLDGTSQPGYDPSDPRPMIELNGSVAGTVSTGLTVTSGGSGSRIAGLVINRFLFRGIELFGDRNLIEGNFIGTDATGTMARANSGDGIRIVTPGNTIGGTTPAARNVISGNAGPGIQLLGLPASNNVVQGNFIGVDVTGLHPIGNLNHGVSDGGASNTIGGSAAGAGNVISGNIRTGVAMLGAVGSVVQGNAIGTDTQGTARLGNGDAGVLFSGASDNLIGGQAPGEGNRIAFNDGAGVSILIPYRDGNRILGNSIYENGELGIDYGGSGSPTTNDTGDTDEFQNWPVLTSAALGSNSITVSGTLGSRRNATYRLEFFASVADDLTGFGEGQTFLGASNVTTNVNGVVDFTVPLDLSGPAGQFITATATDPNGNTSEFSAALLASSASNPDPDPGPDPVDPSTPSVPADFDGDGRSDFATYTVVDGVGRFEIRFATNPGTVSQVIELGGPGDFPVVGDYDGDGRADAGVFGFDPSAGFSTYRIRRSSDDQTITQPFGGPFDFPIAGDYDGDGKTDMAVYGFSPDNGFSRFAVLNSTGGSMTQPFGGLQDFPVVGDYDGDDRDDLAVFGFSADDGFSRFGILYSSGQPTLTLPFGGIDDRPLQGDFDGDGLSDIGVYGFSPDEGFSRFGVLSSSGEPARSIPFGGQDDRPVAGDYDGDGTTDLAVFGFSPLNGFARFGVVPSGGSPAITRQSGSADSIGLAPFSGLFRVQGGSSLGTAARKAFDLSALAAFSGIDDTTDSATASRSARSHWAEWVDQALEDDDPSEELPF